MMVSLPHLSPKKKKSKNKTNTTDIYIYTNPFTNVELINGIKWTVRDRKRKFLVAIDYILYIGRKK